MALPPTYIYRFISDDPETTYNSLRKYGLVKDCKDMFIESLRSAKTAYNKKTRMPGPNLTDTYARVMQGYLTEFGSKLAHTDEFSLGRFQKLRLRINLFFRGIYF